MGGGASRYKSQESSAVAVRPFRASDPDAGRRRFFIGANWKCCLQAPDEVDALVNSLNEQLEVLGPAIEDIDVCVCPPYVFLDRVREHLAKDFQVGGQNAWDAAPPLAGNTGAVTAEMLRALGCTWVLLGHSDRRNKLGETDDLIAAKVEACLAEGLRVNLTIGETLAAREAGNAMDVLFGQLGAAAARVPQGRWGSVAVAYEPVWAVGEGATPCSPQEAQRVHASLRAWLQQHAGEAAARACRFVYTGSVNEQNAEDYARLPDVDGFVVGRAGLDAGKLTSICRTLARCKSG
mmetsp:Transcript_13846/g.43826  ORF Transcript_13846/g.43826 Transcript_13846/m.43826 type:complete len:293 (+) Transcript_13846:69-947(+)